MKNKVIMLFTAIVMLITSALPTSAAGAAPSFLIGSSANVTVRNTDSLYNYTLYLNSNGSGIDADSIMVTYVGNAIQTFGSTANEIAYSSGATFSFDVNGVTPGSYQLPFEIKYTYNGGTPAPTQAISVTMNVTDGSGRSGSVLLANITAPLTAVDAGTPFDLSFDVINEGQTISSVDIAITDPAGVEVASKYISTIEASQTVPFTFAVPTNSNKGSCEYKITMSYRGASAAQTKTETFTVQIGAAETMKELSIRNLTIPEKVVAGAANELTFNLLNTGDVQFIDAQAGISIGDRSGVVSFVYVGAVEPHTATPITVQFTCDEAKKSSFTLRVAYKDANGNSYALSKAFTVDATGEAISSGKLKIQAISAPVYSTKDTANDITFDLTNPTQGTVTGLEATLYDASGKAVDSAYIPSAEPNSSQSISMSYTPTAAGSSSYTLVVSYLDAASGNVTISDSFTTTVREEGEGEETDRPADVKIAKLDSPSRIYTNTKTDLPFVMVNAGKGTAFNIEVYVLDENGTEIARDYIGSLEPSGRNEGAVKLKFDTAAAYQLTIGFDWENGDESRGNVTKVFEQKVDDYRINIDNMSGHDWLVEGEQTNISFNVQNLGPVNLLNVTAQLVDQDGNPISSAFLGTINANSALENQRFKQVMMTSSVNMLNIIMSYENENGDIFTAEMATPQSVHVNTYEEIYGGQDTFEPMPTPEDGEMGEIIGYDENGNPIYADASSGFPVWGIIAIVVGGVIVVGVIVTVIVIKKKKSRDADDDMEYFYAQNGGNPKNTQTINTKDSDDE